MFFKNPNQLPEEIVINEIFKRLPIRDALHLISTSVETHNYTKNNELWKIFGAENYQDFTNKILFLSKKTQALVLTHQYTLDSAIKTQHLLNLPLAERKKWILSLDINGAHQQQLDLLFTVSQLVSDNGIIALHERLFTINELCIFDHINLLDLLLTDNGLIALREKLITPKQAKNADENALMFLLSEYGLNALREHLIFPNQKFNCENKDIPKINRPYGTPLNPSPPLDFALRTLLSDRGIHAFQEHLITIEQAANFFYKDTLLKILLTKNGAAALQEKLISMDEIYNMNKFILHALLSDNGLTALREKLITPEQSANLLSQIDTLLSDEGIKALQHRLITLEEAYSIKDDIRLAEIINERLNNLNPTLTPGNKS